MTITKEFSYGKYLALATDEYVARVDNGYRYGQALFFVLSLHRPDLAERVRGTELDPFFEDTLFADCRIGHFLVWASENWSTS